MMKNTMNDTKTNENTMKRQDYCRFFDNELEAEAHMRDRNRSFRMSPGRFDPFVLVDGPEDDFAVVDIGTAIENDFLYRWAV
jgi:hypothetical protein